MAAFLGRSQGVIDTPLWLRVFPDLKDPALNRVMTWQGGLGLPDREYYLTPSDTRFAAALEAYRAYLVKLARLDGLHLPVRDLLAKGALPQLRRIWAWSASPRLKYRS